VRADRPDSGLRQPGDQALVAFMSDEQLEEQIRAAWQALVDTAVTAEQRAAFERMRDLIAQRSPEQIKRMEEARGLR
jgi:hypothetical protein